VRFHPPVGWLLLDGGGVRFHPPLGWLLLDGVLRFHPPVEFVSLRVGLEPFDGKRCHPSLRFWLGWLGLGPFWLGIVLRVGLDGGIVLRPLPWFVGVFTLLFVPRCPKRDQPDSGADCCGVEGCAVRAG
jgi:hypothetical protein